MCLFVVSALYGLHCHCLVRGMYPNQGQMKFRFPCSSCGEAVQYCLKTLLYEGCDTWYHRNGIGVSSAHYKQLVPLQIFWICCQCGLPNFYYPPLMFLTCPHTMWSHSHIYYLKPWHTSHLVFAQTSASTQIKPYNLTNFKGLVIN